MRTVCPTVDGERLYGCAVTIHLVRHAHAGSRSAWIGDDRDRPLSDKGFAQARLVAERLAPLAPTAIISSPHLRCVQTLEQLALACETSVVHDTRLQEDSPLELSLAALEDAPDGAVLCSHGDVIPDVVNALIRRGMDMGSAPLALRKASMFVLHRVNGLYTHAEYVDPPVVAD